MNRPSRSVPSAPTTVLAVLFAISFSHLLNDTIQALIPSIYPMLKDSFHLSFAPARLDHLYLSMHGVALPADRGLDHRQEAAAAFAGGRHGAHAGRLLALSVADSYVHILMAAALVGLGSAIFHPEASRVAHMAAGARRGFAQILLPARGQFRLVSRAAAGGAGRRLAGAGAHRMVRAARVPGRHHPLEDRHLAGAQFSPDRIEACLRPRIRRRISRERRSRWTLAVLVALIFSKYVYLTSMTTYYTFYLIHRFHVSVQTSQLLLFVFLFSVALGTIIGGPVGDRIGRKRVIWASILGVAPFTLVLPHVGLVATSVLTVFIGGILASAFSAILVYAQELVPGKVGMIAGLFFGLAFGIAGIGSAALGVLADHTSIEFVFGLCAFLPLIGLLTVLLPDIETAAQRAR